MAVRRENYTTSEYTRVGSKEGSRGSLFKNERKRNTFDRDAGDFRYAGTRGANTEDQGGSDSRGGRGKVWLEKGEETPEANGKFQSSHKRSRISNDSEVTHNGTEDRESDAGESNEERNDLNNFPISDSTIASLRSMNIHSLFPIQVKCLEPILGGKDVLGRAKTGTGKTLAFSLPIVEVLNKSGNNQPTSRDRRQMNLPRALIMVPTRELALQVNKVISGICGRLRSLCVYGGTPYIDQIRPLEWGVDIVVGTPGRLIDLIERGNLKLSALKFVCLDEADQMLDIGFAEDMDKVLERVKTDKALPESGQDDARDYQVLLFSATLPNWINKVVKNYMRKDMFFVDLACDSNEATPNLIKHYAINVRWKKRPSVIHDVAILYGDQNSKSARTIIFAEKKGDCNIIAMEEKLSSCGIQAIHGDIPQKQRESTVQGFRDGKFKYLVATNVCARGIDIPEVDLVINCEPPNDVESYIHRSGRTGRAGRPGVCVTLFSSFQEYQINSIKSSTGIDFVFAGPPQQEEILLKSLEPGIQSIIERSEISTNPIFTVHAKRLIEKIGDPVAALSAVLSVHFNVDSLLRPRSILTDTEGFYTVIFKTDQVAHSAGYIRSIIQRKFPLLDVQNDIANMILAEDSRTAVVDINFERVEIVKDADGKSNILITGVPCDSIRGVTIEIAKDLPKLRPKAVNRERSFNSRGGHSVRGSPARYRNHCSR